MSAQKMSQIEGLILSRQQYETAQGVDLILWLATKHGACRVLLSRQRYVFLIQQQDLQQAQQLWSAKNIVAQKIKALTLKSFNGQSVAAIYSLNYRQNSSLQDALSNANIAVFEADIKISDRYLMERFIYGSVCVKGEISWQGSYWQCFDARLSPSNETLSLKYVSLDVECSPQGQLYSVGLSYADPAEVSVDKYGTVLMIGEAQQSPGINIQWLQDEQALLVALQQWFIEHDPDVVIGWAVASFDMRLLTKRAEQHNMQLKIGRDGTALRWLPHSNEPEQGSVILNGRVVLDGIEQLKNASWQFESFSLEFVSQAMFSEGKLITNEHNKGLEIKRQFEQDPVSLARYNLQDCVLVERIFHKAQLIEYALQRARLTGLALDRRGASVAAFTNLYLPLLHRSGYIAPNIGDIEAQHSPGGFVMDSAPGLYSWVLVLDFKSLYPSIIRTFKIDPMGMIEGLKEPQSESIPGFREARFSRSKHHLPGILDK